MSSSIGALPRIIATLNLPRPVGEVLDVARTIVCAMTHNQFFLLPRPPLALLKADIAAVDGDQLDVGARVPGAVARRNAAVAILGRDLQHERNYVQAVADADPAYAAAIIRSAGMAVKQRARPRLRPDLSAACGPNPGSARLIARSAGDRASYRWEASTDGQTWWSLRTTLASKAVVDGLEPNTLHYFRVRATVRTGPRDWTDPVALYVK